jgi:hypothetical protein
LHSFTLPLFSSVFRISRTSFPQDHYKLWCYSVDYMVLRRHNSTFLLCSVAVGHQGSSPHDCELCGQGRVLHAVNARIDRSMHESAVRIERAMGACGRPFGFGKLSRVRTNVAARSPAPDVATSSSSPSDGAPPSTSTAITHPRGVPHHRRRT